MEEITSNEIAIAAALAGALVGSVVGAMGAVLVAGFERRRRGYERALTALAKLTVPPHAPPGERVVYGIADMYPTLYLFLPRRLVNKVTKFGEESETFSSLKTDEREARRAAFVEEVAAKLWRRCGSPLRWLLPAPKYNAWGWWVTGAGKKQ